MDYRQTRWLFAVSLVPLFNAAGYAHMPSSQKLAAFPQGPIHVERNRLVDDRGNPLIIHGTQLPEFRTTPPADPDRPAPAFEPNSATVLSTIRLRWNMNAVRLPLNLLDYESDPKYLQAVDQVVRRANELELLVILRSGELAVPYESRLRFWRGCSGVFKDRAHVLFDLDSPPGTDVRPLIEAVRASGAKQPILVGGETPVEDANAIHILQPRYTVTRTDADRDRQFAALAERVPVLATDLDPQLGRASGECAALPTDPSEAEALVDANLEYFDAHGISWLASEFRPGKLIGEYLHQVATSLENGWTCGQPPDVIAGIGEVVQTHLTRGELRGLFAVNGAGGYPLARGGIAIVYGGISAEKDTRTSRNPLPKELGRMSIRITDHDGVERSAGLLYVAAGWGQANFVVPPDCALGPARVTLVHRDGTRASTFTSIVDVAPGLWAGTGDGRGPAIGFATQAGLGHAPIPIFRCAAGKCATIPIRLSAQRPTTLRLLGTGFRNATSLSDIEVKIHGARVPVLAYGPTGEPGVDDLRLKVPWSLRDAGETDLVLLVRGLLSNVLRIAIEDGEAAEGSR